MSGNLDAWYDAKLAKLNEQKALSDKMQDMLKNHLVPSSKSTQESGSSNSREQEARCVRILSTNR